MTKNQLNNIITIYYTLFKYNTKSLLKKTQNSIHNNIYIQLGSPVVAPVHDVQHG